MTTPEPSTADLAAIEAEWPLIAAELEVLDLECRLARTPSDALTMRAHRRAVRGVLTALAQHSTNHVPAMESAPLSLVPTTAFINEVSSHYVDAA